ncbi:hypothetical protein CEXT_175951 [Caerostris extrusa]|uniref:Uncharacterized protein n=1 Tax=Caerostris extrusa TaxID=172846 RepID=A0AAV4NPS5_CAEEX|nr:hypothetical protein CEXT_175951 [Caerostris extrusa]
MTSMEKLPDLTVLLLPSINLDELKTFVGSAQAASSTHSPEIDPSKVEELISSHASESKVETSQRKKRDVDQSVTVLRDGRIISTDARVYLTPTTHYTTYTYFTTILLPNGGTQVKSSLHVDSVVVEPSERAVYGLGEGPCCDGAIRHTNVDDGYGSLATVRRPVDDAHYHIETVPYDVGRASEVTHRTTFTYYTTRFRPGTSYVETRKETETNVSPLSTGRYSPFEIGTYYDPYHTEAPAYYTEDPYIGGSRPTDITHRTTYTYYTTRFRNGVPIVETHKDTVTDSTLIPTYYRPGQVHTNNVRTALPSYSQRIDPNLYRPSSTETNVTPIPTYSRPRNTIIRTQNRVVPTRVVERPVDRTVYDYPNRGSDPYITHRTTFTYYTTRLIGGDVQIDTRYVTETNVSPNPTVPYVRGTVHAQPNYDGYDYYETECPVCRESQRATPVRYVPNTRIASAQTLEVPRHGVRGRTPDQRSERLQPSIRPSTATHYSTYTYATTQLERGGNPVVRTREHTVTEVLSDVVLQLLNLVIEFVRRELYNLRKERVPTNNGATGRSLVRHNFARGSSYADGRQGRRIATNGKVPDRNRVNNYNSGIKPKENAQPNGNRYPNNVPYADSEIKKPTSITYYSTYTYFTTELGDGTPVIKTREHTVTEILTDVIVPTVSRLRKVVENTESYQARNRRIRSIDTNVFRRKLLSVSDSDIENDSSISPTSVVTPPLPVIFTSTSSLLPETLKEKDRFDIGDIYTTEKTSPENYSNLNETLVNKFTSQNESNGVSKQTTEDDRISHSAINTDNENKNERYVN